MNGMCLIEVLRCAGFKQVRIVSQFTLPNRRVPSLKVLHLVAHAARGRVGRLARWHGLCERAYEVYWTNLSQ